MFFSVFPFFEFFTNSKKKFGTAVTPGSPTLWKRKWSTPLWTTTKFPRKVWNICVFLSLICLSSSKFNYCEVYFKKFLLLKKKQNSKQIQLSNPKKNPQLKILNRRHADMRRFITCSTCFPPTMYFTMFRHVEEHVRAKHSRQNPARLMCSRYDILLNRVEECVKIFYQTA